MDLAILNLDQKGTELRKMVCSFKAAIPLQAADLMAFEVFDPMRKWLQDGRLLKLSELLRS